MSNRRKLIYLILFIIDFWWLITSMTSCKTVTKTKEGFYRVQKFGRSVVTDDSTINLNKI
jgi:hypothetical protein